MTRPVASRFSPHLVAPENLERLMVGREHLIRQMLQDLEGTISAGGARYELLVGPRGAGKSHVLAVLRDRALKDPGIGGRAATALLAEEEHVASLLDLLARILRAMPEVEGHPPGQTQAERLRDTPGAEGEARAVSFLEQRLQGRPLVLFMENLDFVFEALRAAGQSRLRNILQSHPTWSVVASSRRWSQEFSDRKAPFFNAFIRRDLPPMSAELCRGMLMKLATVYEHQPLYEELQAREGLARVRTIHHMLGGSPRAMAMIYPHLVQHTLNDLEAAFFDLSEELTPYFQEQMARLSPGQRPVLELLAENWRPISVSELARATFSTPQTLTSHLRVLRSDRLVRSIGVGRERFYEVSEPLFRLARAMKRPDQVVQVLIRFVRAWYLRHELEDLASRWADGEERKKLVQAALGWVDEDGGEYGRAMWAQVHERLEAQDPVRAVDLATEHFDTVPCTNSALGLAVALGRAERWEELQDLCEHNVGRFGAEFAVSSLIYASRERIALSDVARKTAVALAEAIPHDQPARTVAIMALLMEPQTPADRRGPLVTELAELRERAPSTAHAGWWALVVQALVARHEPALALQVADAVGLARLGGHTRRMVVFGLAALGQIDEIRARHEPLLRDLPEDVHRMRLEVDLALAVGAWPEAARLAQEGLRRWPDDPVLHQQAALSLQGAGLPEEEHHQRWIADHDDVPIDVRVTALRRLATLGMSRLDLRTVHFTLQRLLTLKPEDSNARTLQVVLLVAEGDLAQARALGLELPERDQREAAEALIQTVAASREGTPPAGRLGRHPPIAGPVGAYVFVASVLGAIHRRGAGDWLQPEQLLGDEIAPAWVESAASGIARLSGTSITRLALAPALRILLEAWSPWLGPAADLPRALLALPEDLEPYARLSAPERELAQQFLREGDETMRTLLKQLPREDDPSQAC